MAAPAALIRWTRSEQVKMREASRHCRRFAFKRSNG
jgi:hypothetical protein